MLLLLFLSFCFVLILIFWLLSRYVLAFYVPDLLAVPGVLVPVIDVELASYVLIFSPFFFS